jgi:hypothetical protein
MKKNLINHSTSVRREIGKNRLKLSQRAADVVTNTNQMGAPPAPFMERERNPHFSIVERHLRLDAEALREQSRLLEVVKVVLKVIQNVFYEAVIIHASADLSTLNHCACVT